MVSFSVLLKVGDKEEAIGEGLSIGDLQAVKFNDILENVTLCEMFEEKEFTLTVKLHEV